MKRFDFTGYTVTRPTNSPETVWVDPPKGSGKHRFVLSRAYRMPEWEPLMLWTTYYSVKTRLGNTSGRRGATGAQMVELLEAFVAEYEKREAA